MLTMLLRSTEKFPCVRFRFNTGNLGNGDAQRFFTLYGSSIKSLSTHLDPLVTGTDDDYDGDEEEGFYGYEL